MKQPVEFIKDFPKIKLVGRKLGPYREGEEVEVRPWIASVLEERGLVRFVDDFSLTGIRKRLIREEKSSQLEELPSYFYFAISRKIADLREEGRGEKAEELEDTVDSLVGLRVKKIANRAVSSSVPKGVPPDEKFLLNLLSHSLNIWRQKLGSLFEKTTEKEAGVHERRIRRSIQGIVRNPADI